MATPITDVWEVSRGAYGFMGSKALFSALNIDLFSRLAANGKTLETLIEETSVAANRLSTPLAALWFLQYLAGRIDGISFSAAALAKRLKTHGHENFSEQVVIPEITKLVTCTKRANGD